MSSQCMTHIWPLDLYVMLQWFCRVSPTLSNRKASYFGYLFSLTLSVTSYYLEVTVTYISWSSDFALYFWLYLIDKHHTLGTCSVPYCEWLHIFCRSLWLIFHGPVILPCISDPIKWEGIIFWILVWHFQWPHTICRSLWPIFHGPVMLPYISGSISNIVAYNVNNLP